jgi:Mg2+ and Co2+ transporter CorA
MKVLSIITIIFLVSTLICGLWMKFAPEGTNPDVNFHAVLSIVTIILSMVTIILHMRK